MFIDRRYEGSVSVTRVLILLLLKAVCDVYNFALLASLNIHPLHI